MLTIQALGEALEREGLRLSYGEDLSKHASFRIGGPCALAVFPHTVDLMIRALTLVGQSGLRFAVMGNASNVLFADEGFDGVMLFTTDMRQIRFDGERVRAESGAMLSSLSYAAYEHGLDGLAFAFGIPGTVGGAVYMNAGAYGGEIAGVVERTLCYDCRTGQTLTVEKGEHGFAYRTSRYAKEDRLIVLEAELCLHPVADKAAVYEVMRTNGQQRRDKQPLEYPNAGSTFKRPVNAFAGKLIEDCGLKGYRIGGAAVSEKHAGFVVNVGGATARDVLSLIEHVQKTVKDRFGVMLECEIQYIS